VHPAHRGAPADHEPRGRVGRATIDPSFDLGSQRDCQRPEVSIAPTDDRCARRLRDAGRDVGRSRGTTLETPGEPFALLVSYFGVAQNILDFRTDREPSRDAKNGQPR